MQYGTPISLLRDGFLIGGDSLAPIGIVDKSTCWGTWVPNRNADEPMRRSHEFAHFLISPFEPSSWPVLFRIEIAIDGDNNDALSAAVGPLSRKGMSILSIDVTPAGHRHFWVTVIAEAIDLKIPGGPLEKFKKLSQRRRTPRDEKTWDMVHTDLAPPMLKRAAEIVASVETDDDSHDFLRAIFLDPERPSTTGKQPRFERGVLYNYAELPDHVRALGKAQRTPAVRCTWMQNHAFFWLYRRSDPLELYYSEEHRLMKVDPVREKSFGEGIQEFPASSQAIMFIDQIERFGRVVLSSDDLRSRTARVIIPFHARYDMFEGSRGFQQKLYSDLTTSSHLKIRHVSMATQYRNLEEEKGELSLLVSSADHSLGLPQLDKLRDSVQRVADEAADALLEQGCSMTCRGVMTQNFSAPLVFLSTRFDWLEKFDSNFTDKIQQIAATEGFNAITGDARRLGRLEELVPEIRGRSSLTDIITALIRNCSAFLQIIPIEVLGGGRRTTAKATEGSLNWLLFEFGAARALDLPYEILVDVRKAEADVGSWQRLLKVGAGFPLRTFDSSTGSESLHCAMRNALAQLSLRVPSHARS